MNKLRCFLFATIVVISSRRSRWEERFRLRAKAHPAPTPTPTALTTTSTSDGQTQPTSTEEIQIVWQDATTMLVEILLTIF